MRGRQKVTHHTAYHRRAPQAAAHHHFKAHFTRCIFHRMQSNIVNQSGSTVLSRARDGNFEFARQISKLRVQRAPLADDFAVRARVYQLVTRHTGKVVAGGVPYTVPRGLDGVHFDFG